MHQLFIDFGAAYDSTVNLRLHTAMRAFGIPTKLIRLTDDEKCAMPNKNSRFASRTFTINNGVRLEDALSSIPFKLALGEVIHAAEVNVRGTCPFKSS